MRLPILILVLVSACGTDEGAVLTLTAPADLVTTNIEIVLASADPATITDVSDQRVAPKLVTAGKARYYRQRAEGGTIGGLGALDGFTVRIEPHALTAPDESFIPFVLAYNNDVLVAIGSVDDASGEPMAVTIKPGVARKYAVTMQPLAPAADDAAIEAAQVRSVSCRPDAPWVSGVAWQPAAGVQRRLMLPDVEQDPLASDATMRPTDLDCDTHEAGDTDCDDLRERFYRGHAEVCDGYDSNCDGARYEVVTCPLGGGSTGACGSTTVTTGVALCDEMAPDATRYCSAGVTCECKNGSQACVRCMVDYLATSTPGKQQPCSPAAGSVVLERCQVGNTCDVEIASTTNGIEAALALGPAGSFGPRVTGVHSGVVLRVKSGTSNVMANATESIGAVYLTVTQGAVVELVGIDIELSTGPANAGCAIISSGLSRMTCM